MTTTTAAAALKADTTAALTAACEKLGQRADKDAKMRAVLQVCAVLEGLPRDAVGKLADQPWTQGKLDSWLVSHGVDTGMKAGSMTYVLCGYLNATRPGVSASSANTPTATQAAKAAPATKTLATVLASMTREAVCKLADVAWQKQGQVDQWLASVGLPAGSVKADDMADVLCQFLNATRPGPAQQSAAATAAPTVAQQPAAPKPDAKAVQAEVDSLAADVTIRRKAAADALTEATRQDKLASDAKNAAAAAREQHATLTAKADALDSKRAGLLTLLASLVNVPVPAAPAKPEPLSQSDNVLACEPKVQPPVVVPPTAPVVNPNASLPLAQKDAMRLGKDGLVKLAQQLIAAGKLTGPIDTTGRGWLAKLASRVAKASQNPAADKPAPQANKAATPPAKLVPTVPGLFVADGKGGYRPATEAEVWAALDAMSKAAA